MAQTAHQTRYEGGLCYASCNELFSFWNPSIQQCWKGCDFGVGRVNDAEGRTEAQQMCKRWAAELLWTYKGELDTIKDLRVHAEMYPTTPQNVYKACLAGVRRQKY